jgi:hypothetical protein
MSLTPRQISPGVPASFPLPVSGQPGAQYQRNAKLHPAAFEANTRAGAGQGGRPTMGGRK